MSDKERVMDGKASELTVLMEVIELRGERLRLRRELRELREANRLLTLEREQLCCDLDLLAGAVCGTVEFDEWLLSQDASSAVLFSPGKKRNLIEGKTDVDLAKMFIAATEAG